MTTDGGGRPTGAQAVVYDGGVINVWIECDEARAIGLLWSESRTCQHRDRRVAGSVVHAATGRK